MSDLLPTLASAAGIPQISNIDGISHWNSLVNGEKLARSDILNNIDLTIGYSSYMRDGWKIVNGTTNNGSFDGWLSTANEYKFSHGKSYVNYLKGKIHSLFNITMEENQILKLRNSATVNCNNLNNINIQCIPLKDPCLFNIIDDPCEMKNLAKIFPLKLLEMQKHLEQYILETIPTRRHSADPNSDPANFNGSWNWWIK